MDMVEYEQVREPQIPDEEIELQRIVDKYKNTTGSWDKDKIQDFVNDLFNKNPDGPRLEGTSLRQFKSLRDELSKTFHHCV